MRQVVFVLAAILSGVSVAMSTAVEKTGLDFRSLMEKQQGASEPAALESFEARDGARLQYRLYPGESETALVLVHGSAADSRYLSSFARALAQAGAANVYTPDVRGHGPSPAERGDIDYIGQLEDDLADLVLHIMSTSDGVEKVVVGGHSSGGGLAVRFAGGDYGGLAAGYLLLAPYLGHDAPTVRENSGGWANPNLFKIIPLSVLNSVGVTLFNGARVLQFHLPAEYREGNETLSYSYRLMRGFGPSDFRTELRAVNAPILLVAGSGDEALLASEFEPTVRPLVPDADIRLIDGASHLGIVVDERAIESVREWLQRL